MQAACCRNCLEKLPVMTSLIRWVQGLFSKVIDSSPTPETAKDQDCTLLQECMNQWYWVEVRFMLTLMSPQLRLNLCVGHNNNACFFDVRLCNRVLKGVISCVLLQVIRSTVQSAPAQVLNQVIWGTQLT